MVTRWRPSDRRVQCGLLALATVLGTWWLRTQPGLALQLTVLGGLVVMAGLPHGALDVAIALRRGWLETWRSGLVFHLAYVALAAVVVGLWLIQPLATLCAFLLISAWHFGGDWALSRLPALRMLLGVSLLSLPALKHPEQVSALYEFLAPGRGADLAHGQSLFAPAGSICLLVLALWAARARQWSDGVELLVLLIGGVWLPPLIFFAVYFCALHSPRNFLIEWGQWEGSGTHRRILLLTYTGAAAASMAALLWLQARMALSLEAALARTLFIGLAALTVPHMALAYWVRRPAPL
jgi:hypothetical protein